MTERSVGDLTWIHEDTPVWNADKARVIGGAPAGVFALNTRDGDHLPGEWWAVHDAAGLVVGYGRLDTGRDGNGDVLLAVALDRQQRGIGSFILKRLEEEAAIRGVAYIHNRIREHPERDLVHDWLVVRGFRGPVSGDLCKRVQPRHERSATARSQPAGNAWGSRERGASAAGRQEQHDYAGV